MKQWPVKKMMICPDQHNFKCELETGSGGTPNQENRHVVMVTRRLRFHAAGTANDGLSMCHHSVYTKQVSWKFSSHTKR